MNLLSGVLIDKHKGYVFNITFPVVLVNSYEMSACVS